MALVVRAWQTVCRIDKIGRQLKDAKKKHFKEREETRAVELEEALAVGSFAEAWRAARAMSLKPLGPKRRRYDSVAFLPSKQEWTEAMQKSGPEGGCAAVVVNPRNVVLGSIQCL